MAQLNNPLHGKTLEMILRDLVEKLGRSPGFNPEDVMVVITTTASEDWSFGGGRGH